MKKIRCNPIVVSNFLFVFCIVYILHIFIPPAVNTVGITWSVHFRLNSPYILHAYGENAHGRSNATTDSLRDNKYKNNPEENLQSNKKSSRNWNTLLSTLLVDSLSSLYRMFAALGLSFIAAISLGILSARNSIASKIVMPIVDILQSVPILGFFPAAIAFFITLF
ncbi:MAG: hypothetical protein ACTHME_04435, partial [Candidatus Nitrosocosmicus sp.]